MVGEPLVLEVYRITLLSNQADIEKRLMEVLEVYRITLLSNSYHFNCR